MKSRGLLHACRSFCFFSSKKMEFSNTFTRHDLLHFNTLWYDLAVQNREWTECSRANVSLISHHVHYSDHGNNCLLTLLLHGHQQKGKMPRLAMLVCNLSDAREIDWTRPRRTFPTADELNATDVIKKKPAVASWIEGLPRDPNRRDQWTLQDIRLATTGVFQTCSDSRQRLVETDMLVDVKRDPRLVDPPVEGEGGSFLDSVHVRNAFTDRVDVDIVDIVLIPPAQIPEERDQAVDLKACGIVFKVKDRSTYYFDDVLSSRPLVSGPVVQSQDPRDLLLQYSPRPKRFGTWSHVSTKTIEGKAAKGEGRKTISYQFQD